MADILALAKLIEQTTPSQQQEELLSRSSTTTPASLVPSATPQLSNATSPRAQASRVEEVHEEPDDRKIPEYTITYKQKVGVEDVYLGISGRANSILDCNEIVIKISLPGCRPTHINVNPSPMKIDLTTPDYKLALDLTHEIVCEGSGTAQWDATKELLILTFPLRTEDVVFVNAPEKLPM